MVSLASPVSLSLEPCSLRCIAGRESTRGMVGKRKTGIRDIGTGPITDFKFIGKVESQTNN